MKNIFAVFCAVLLPLSSTPQIAFAAKGEAKHVVYKGITYVEVKVPGQTKEFFCESKDCENPEKFKKLGSVALYSDFDSAGDPTLSKFTLTYDKASNKRIVTKELPAAKLNGAAPKSSTVKTAPKNALRSLPPKAAEPHVKTEAPDPGDHDPTPVKAEAAPSLFETIKEKIPSPASALELRVVEYLVRKQTDKPADQKALLDKSLPALREQAAGIIASVAEHPATAANAHVLAFLKGKSLDGSTDGAKIDSTAFLDAFCAQRDVPGLAQSKDPSALKQLEAAQKSDMGKTADGKVVSQSKASALDGKCAERKKEQALASAAPAGYAFGHGSVAPPAPGSASSTDPGSLAGLGNFVGGMAGGAALAVVFAAIVGGPLGLAAVAGALAGGVIVEVYAHHAEIADGLSKFGASIGSFFKS